MQKWLVVINIQHGFIGTAQFQGETPGTADHGFNMILGKNLDAFCTHIQMGAEKWIFARQPYGPPGKLFFDIVYFDTRGFAH